MKYIFIIQLGILLAFSFMWSCYQLLHRKELRKIESQLNISLFAPFELISKLALFFSFLASATAVLLIIRFSIFE